MAVRWFTRSSEQHSADWSWYIEHIDDSRWLVVVAGVEQCVMWRRSDARAVIGSFKDYM